MVMAKSWALAVTLATVLLVSSVEAEAAELRLVSALSMRPVVDALRPQSSEPRAWSPARHHSNARVALRGEEQLLDGVQ